MASVMFDESHRGEYRLDGKSKFQRNFDFSVCLSVLFPCAGVRRTHPSEAGRNSQVLWRMVRGKSIRLNFLQKDMMNIILIIESICLSLDLDIKFLKAFLLDGLKTKILHPINYLDMSGIQQRTKIHFIAALLAHSIADVDFHSHKGVWITSDVLASALNIHYCIVCIDKILNV